ncbi:MAG: sugar transferase [Bacteroidota bacterium]
MNLAPICLFTYKRLDCTIQTVEALQKNTLASESKLYVFSDGAKKESDWDDIHQVRKYLDGVNGFKEIIRINRDKNIGLANSIITGVSEVVNNHGRVIVLEDDLLTTPNFLHYMNEALEFYQDQSKIFSIAGYTITVTPPANYDFDVYTVPRTSPWGWASWQDRWNTVDWEVSKYETFKDNAKMRRAFNEGGSDLANMLDRQMKDKLDSWAIRWGFQQFNNDQLTIFPTISKIRNIGFGKDATHTKFYDRYRSKLDDSANTHFKFTEEVKPHKKFVNTYKAKYSLFTRFVGRLKHYLGLP